MELRTLRPAADLHGDVVTAYVDVNRTDAQGALGALPDVVGAMLRFATRPA